MSKCSICYNTPVLFLLLLLSTPPPLGTSGPSKPPSRICHYFRFTGALPSSCHRSVPSVAHALFLLFNPSSFSPPGSLSHWVSVPVLQPPRNSAPGPRPQGNAVVMDTAPAPSTTIPSPHLPHGAGGFSNSDPAQPAPSSQARRSRATPTLPRASRSPAEPRGPRGRARQRAAAPAH